MSEPPEPDEASLLPPGASPIESRYDFIRIEQPPTVSGSATYVVWGTVEPRENFGLPNGDVVVHPSNDEWVTMHWPLEGGGTRWGTMSRYRSDDEAIKEPLDLGPDVRGSIVDNNVAVEIADASDAQAAVRTGIEAVERLLSNLSVSTGVRMRFEFRGIRVNDGTRVNVLRPVGNYRAVLYGLEALRTAIREDQAYARLVDERLGRAFDYYMHALFLMEVGNDADRRSKDPFLIHSAVFLNLWKSIAVIVGDSRERDFQSRYKRLGLDYAFFKSKIEWMKDIRDDRDVAHHDLSADGIDALREVQSQGVEIAKQVISAYRTFLAAGGVL